MTSMFERMQGTPCAGCRHMSWDLLSDQPWGICTVQVRNKYGKWKPAAAKCAKLGFEFYEPEEWKAEKAEAWAKKNGAPVPESAALPW